MRALIYVGHCRSTVVYRMRVYTTAFMDARVRHWKRPQMRLEINVPGAFVHLLLERNPIFPRAFVHQTVKQKTTLNNIDSSVTYYYLLYTSTTFVSNIFRRLFAIDLPLSSEHAAAKITKKRHERTLYRVIAVPFSFESRAVPLHTVALRSNQLSVHPRRFHRVRYRNNFMARTKSCKKIQQELQFDPRTAIPGSCNADKATRIAF